MSPLARLLDLLREPAWDATLLSAAQAALGEGAGEAESSAVAAALLRRALAALGGGPPGEPAVREAAAAELPCLAHCASLACAALQRGGAAALGARARPRELELQRYALARRLLLRGAPAAAWEQAGCVMAALGGAAALPPPAEDASRDAGLAVGAALVAVGAAAELKAPPALVLSALSCAASLPAWLRRGGARARQLSVRVSRPAASPRTRQASITTRCSERSASWCWQPRPARPRPPPPPPAARWRRGTPPPPAPSACPRWRSGWRPRCPPRTRLASACTPRRWPFRGGRNARPATAWAPRREPPSRCRRPRRRAPPPALPHTPRKRRTSPGAL